MKVRELQKVVPEVMVGAKGWSMLRKRAINGSVKGHGWCQRLASADRGFASTAGQQGNPAPQGLCGSVGVRVKIRELQLVVPKVKIGDSQSEHVTLHSYPCAHSFLC